MIYTILAILAGWVALTIETLGYGGIFLLMAAESAGIPIPSELIMPFSGFLAASGVFSLSLVIVAGVLGNIAGSLLFYEIGLRWGRPFIERYGKYFFIHPRDVDLAERWFARWGAWAAFVGRMLPAIRTYISFPAGVARMPRGKFVVVSSIGVLPWVAALAWMGDALGERWHSLQRYFHTFDYVIAFFLVAGAVWWIARHIRQHSTDGIVKSV